MRSFFIGRKGRSGQIGIAAALGLALAALSGCDLSHSPAASVQLGTALHGQVRGGQQPVSGASIVLYAAGAAGDGAGSTNLLAPNVVTTDTSGNFDITSDYSCPSANTQVYIVASGGNPGLGSEVDNSALVMMAALGNCGNLDGSTSIVINEATTVAAAWALAQFLAPGAVVGSTPTNPPASRTPLRSRISRQHRHRDRSRLVPSGRRLTETAKLNTLADALAVCVNSAAARRANHCLPLLQPPGCPHEHPRCGPQHRAQSCRQCPAVFNASGSQGPFQPALSSQPNDWTMSITYGGCTPACGGLNTPGSLAIDSAGNILVANYFGGVVSEFSPAGVPEPATGIAGTGLEQSYSITIDGSDNVWVTNYQSVSGANNHHWRQRQRILLLRRGTLRLRLHRRRRLLSAGRCGGLHRSNLGR